MKKMLSIVLAVAMLATMCSFSAVAEATYTAGTYTGESNGFGGAVTVALTVDGSSITAVEITAADETPAVGGAAVDKLADQIMAAQSADIDGVTGATLTSNAVKAAAAHAIAAAAGTEVTVAEAKLADGTYTASAWGFSQVRQVPVTVTVADGKISDITVDCDTAKETQWYLQSAIDNMIPRMLEYQSYGVDAVTGATTSSNAIKTAVRDCLEQALTAGGSEESAIENFNVAQPKNGGEETIDVDVLVVGMGGTGSAAALKSAELQKAAGKDVSVLAIEKAGTYGGTSASTTSLLAFNSSKTIEQYGESMQTNTDDVAAYLTASGILGAGNKYAEWYWNDIFSVSGELVDWLIDNGFYFGEARKGFWGDWATQYYYCDSCGEDNLTKIHDCFDTMIANYVALGGKYMTETEGYKLIYDEATNTVTGVKARSLVDGTEYTINAKAVIMATGGFGGSDEMMAKYNTGAYWEFGDTQNDGVLVADAIDNLGAGTLGMNASMWGGVHNICTAPQLHDFDYIFAEDGTTDIWRGDIASYSLNDVPNIIVASYDSLWVSTEGERKVNEDMTWGWPLMGPYYWAIVDQDYIDNIAANGFTENHVELFCNAGYATFPLNVGIDSLEEGYTMQDVLDACEKNGIMVSADSVEELAEKMGVDPAVLTATVDTYNAGCESGTDAFGKNAAYLKSMTGKLYAFYAAPRTYSSIGGLDVNDKLQVIKADGETVINGLYAGGTDCLGATAPAFGGELQVWAYMSGYLAAEAVNEYIGQ